MLLSVTYLVILNNVSDFYVHFIVIIISNWEGENVFYFLFAFAFMMFFSFSPSSIFPRSGMPTSSAPDISSLIHSRCHLHNHSMCVCLSISVAGCVLSVSFSHNDKAFAWLTTARTTMDDNNSSTTMKTTTAAVWMCGSLTWWMLRTS